MSMRGSMTFTPVRHEQHGIKTLIIYIPRVTRQKARDKTRENELRERIPVPHDNFLAELHARAKRARGRSPIAK